MKKQCALVRCYLNTRRGYCQRPTCTQWEFYRRKTGHCETCGERMDTHPRCAACDVLADNGHENTLSKFRGVLVCGHCIAAWKLLERRTGRSVPLERFLSPQGKRIKADDEQVEVVSLEIKGG